MRLSTKKSNPAYERDKRIVILYRMTSSMSVANKSLFLTFVVCISRQTYQSIANNLMLGLESPTPCQVTSIHGSRNNFPSALSSILPLFTSRQISLACRTTISGHTMSRAPPFQRPCLTPITSHPRHSRFSSTSSRRFLRFRIILPGASLSSSKPHSPTKSRSSSGLRLPTTLSRPFKVIHSSSPRPHILSNEPTSSPTNLHPPR